MCEVAKITEKPTHSDKHEGPATKLSDSMWKEMQHGTPSRAEKPPAKDGSLEMTDPYKSKCGPMNFNPSILEEGKPEPKNPSAQSGIESKPHVSQEGGTKKPAPLEGTGGSTSGEHKEITKDELKEMFKNWKVPGEAMKIGS